MCPGNYVSPEEAFGLTCGLDDFLTSFKGGILMVHRGERLCWCYLYSFRSGCFDYSSLIYV